MKLFECRCGARVFFENSLCLGCGSELGFDPSTLRIAAGDGGRFAAGLRICRNSVDFGICNWLVPEDAADEYCVSCALNRTIPHLGSGNNFERWGTLERAKRRLLYSLLQMGLPVKSKARGWPEGLAFDFVEDQRTNPAVQEPFVPTGHVDGLITINVAEADQLYRLQMRLGLGEVYRTVLGHFRHESGHYYQKLLIGDRNIDAFRRLFGDERVDYEQALDDYYQTGGAHGGKLGYISAYACSHPLEDWAETWAHYLLIHDALETARAERGLKMPRDVDHVIDQWIETSTQLNQIARSLGIDDPYPFVVCDEVREKLRFVDSNVRAVGLDR